MKLVILGQDQQFNEDSAAVAGYDLGGGIAALLMIAVTAVKTTVTASSTSVVILAANTTDTTGRKGAIIVNGGSTTLHLTVQAGMGTPPKQIDIPAGAQGVAPEAYQGAIEGWWDGSPTGAATVTEIL